MKKPASDRLEVAVGGINRIASVSSEKLVIAAGRKSISNSTLISAGGNVNIAGVCGKCSWSYGHVLACWQASKESLPSTATVELNGSKTIKNSV